jgi:hypothetical protein
MDDVVSNTAAASDHLGAILAAVSDDSASAEDALTGLVRRVLWPLSSSAKAGVGTKKTTGRPHDHSTAAAPCGCHVIDVPFTGANEKTALRGQFVKSGRPDLNRRPLDPRTGE